MKYVPPLGVSDPDASWINGDSTQGRQGSIPPAAVFENPQREIVNVISRSNLTPTDADLQQLTKAIRSQFLNFVEDTGSVNNLNVALDPPLTTYTRGLVLRVRVRFTNTDASVRINAGAGNVFIRKMNGADVGIEQLPAGAIVTLVYDGTNFQLSNFGGGGEGPGDVFRVYIPYVEDNGTPGQVRAWFSPPFSQAPSRGEVILVKIAHTNPGPITLDVDGFMSPALPNGGGGAVALQGDIHAGDVIIFFYDGQAWWFATNPEISQPVVYTVGASGQFTSVDGAMAAIRRKTIGANGWVTLKLDSGVWGPIAVNHPSADRLEVRGTMIGPRPLWNTLQANASSAAQRAQDNANNIVLLRQRYGTEIHIPSGGGVGLLNTGPGRPTFRDLLVTGNQLPWNDIWAEVGVSVTYPVGSSGTNHLYCDNVVVWGTVSGFVAYGTMTLNNCMALGNSYYGIGTGGGTFFIYSCASMSNGSHGCVNAFGSVYSINCQFRMNAGSGGNTYAAGGAEHWLLTSVGNAGNDLEAASAGAIILVNPMSFGTTSPAPGVVGNGGAFMGVSVGGTVNRPINI